MFRKATALPKAKARFGFEVIDTPLLGKTHRPILPVQVWSEVYQSWSTVRMLLDTGADYTIFPRYIAGLLGIDLQKETKQVTSFGLGGEQTIHFFQNLRLKIGKLERIAPVGFAESNKVAPLLGRHLLLETLTVKIVGNTAIEFWDL